MISTEKNTQTAILEYLEFRGIFHYRQNTGALRTERGGFYRFGAPGAPDIVVVHRGIYIGIEVKDIKGKLNENQKAFRDALEKANGVYILARDVDTVIKYFEEHR